MYLDPRNRYVLVSEIDASETQEKSTILVPEEYTAKTSPYGVYQIQQFSSDCTKVDVDDIGKCVVVNDAMVETASLAQGDFLLVLENYIYGVLDG